MNCQCGFKDVQGAAGGKGQAAKGATRIECKRCTVPFERRSPVPRYEAEMEIWKPKWEAYRKTDSYKEFCLLKQELMALLSLTLSLIDILASAFSSDSLGLTCPGVQGQEGEEKVLEGRSQEGPKEVPASLCSSVFKCSKDSHFYPFCSICNGFRPRPGYGIFSDEIRNRVKEAVG